MHRGVIQSYEYDFQLHTVHQEQFVNWLAPVRLRGFQLHTVHQEQNGKEVALKRRLLSTPHGALGTGKKDQRNTSRENDFQLHTVHQEPLPSEGALSCFFPFNSTRCIRNISCPFVWDVSGYTFNSTRCIRNQLGFLIYALGLCPFNSTRCIRNG